MKICRRSSVIKLRPLCFLVLLVFTHTSESLFFHTPHGLLMNLVNSLIGHKQMKPIHHFHAHYYPVPVPMLVPKITPPPKIEIDLSTLLSGHDWTNQDYGKLHENVDIPPPHPDASWSSPISESWPDSTPLQQKSSWGWDNNEILEKDQVYKEAKPPGILLQVPLKQQIVLYQPPTKDTKSSLLSIFLKKLRRVSNALLHPEEEENVEHPNNAPHITNSLTYVGP